jgi:hypothetical protein
VNAPLEVAVPPRVVTLTSAAPAEWAGLVVVIWVALLVLMGADVPPKVTEVAPVRLVPVIVTGVPPEVDPVPGDTEVIVGGGGGGVI